uniref:Peroxidasin n=1 Tax=Hemiscolopendra marginata TaxID=943146 RepID=A0A646QDL0_9MYRI
MGSVFVVVAAVLLLSLVGNRVTLAEGLNCPDRCLCFRTTVRCMFLQLDHVPSVPRETTILDLRFNKIKDIPAGTFTDLHHLNTLLLNNNLMTKIENNTFIGLKELRYLYLYKNRIKTIESKAFHGLQKLEQLYLHFNRIENLETDSFSDLRTLDRLFLHNNKLTRIPPGAFRNLDSLRRLRLDSNALICDCKMMWLARMLKDKSTTTQSAATCEYPSSLQGKPLTAIKEADFHCKKPLLTEEPDDVDVSFGGTAYFACRAEGDPNPDIIWIHNDDEIEFNNDENTNRYNLLNDGTLMIENTQASDQGFYECMAKNPLGEVKSRKAKMQYSNLKDKSQVHSDASSNNVNSEKYNRYERVTGSSPRFVTTPHGQEVREKETVVFVCEATGNPRPFITWTLNERPLSNLHRFRISSTGTLTITNVISEDAGSYRCSASNTLGQISTVAYLKVQVPPVITTFPLNQTVSEGRLAEFRCDADGSPSPHLTWLKNGRTIVPTTRILFDLDGTLLRIGSIHKSDEGKYKCRAQNIAGTAEATAVLKVNAKIPPSFLRRPQNMEVFSGSDVELPCAADGEPTPLIIWRKNGVLMGDDNDNHSFGNDGSLLLYNVDKLDEAMYECGADNGIGYVSSFAQVKIKDGTTDGGSKHPGDRFVQISIEEARFSVDRALNDTITSIYARDRKPFTPAELLRLFRFPRPSAREKARSAEIYERTLLVIKRHVESGAKFNLSDDFSYSDILSPSQLETIANLSGCLTHRRHINCSEMCFHSRYRTIDGTCNNLQHPMWGASETPFYRLLKPIYENGFNTPIGWSRTSSLYHGFAKPSARLISTRIISTDDITPDDDYSHMLMQWGQFLDHDLDLAPPTISSESFVDGEDCSQSCEYAAPCFPIEIPTNDPRIQNHRCMEFTRSSPVCGSGSTSLLFDSVMPREQINVLTSFIDASQVYGSSEKESDQVRDHIDREGQLRKGPQVDTGKFLLPFSVDWPIDCRRDPRESNIGCFLAGDTRVNEQVGLIAMHTIWFREHNRIAKKLHEVNPHWDSETLYHEARKIVGAEMQHITYKHWLPKIFGPKGMELLGTYEGYKPNVEAAISNSFATAALRFGHTLINPILHRLNATLQPITQGHLPLSRAFFSPFRIMEEGGIDPLLRGFFAMPAKIRRSNQLLNKELTEQLFRQVHAVALDLAAINIQRGRDHALPGYNQWRKLCNLNVVKTFHDLRFEIKSRQLRENLQQLYGHPDNIDLWVGGVSEDLAPGARVGPTFLCILADQFKRLRDGDRFYYENPGIFKPEQLTQIKQSSLARVICDNGDNITQVTLDAFLVPQRQTPPYESCSKIPGMELRFWSDCCNDCSELGNFLSITKTTNLQRSKRSTGFSYPEDKPKSFAAHSSSQENQISSLVPEIAGKTIPLHEDLFEERVEGMEEVIQKLQKQLRQLNKKMKQFQSDCHHPSAGHCIDSNGITRYSNETWSIDKCSTCHCINGQITCQVQVCSLKDCQAPSSSDECCHPC